MQEEELEPETGSFAPNLASFFHLSPFQPAKHGLQDAEKQMIYTEYSVKKEGIEREEEEEVGEDKNNNRRDGFLHLPFLYLLVQEVEERRTLFLSSFFRLKMRVLTCKGTHTKNILLVLPAVFGQCSKNTHTFLLPAFSPFVTIRVFSLSLCFPSFRFHSPVLCIIHSLSFSLLSLYFIT